MLSAQCDRLGFVAVDATIHGFLSITFQGETLADFASLGFDDHVKFMIDGADGTQVRRDYTPRRFSREARELVIEFALHGEGAASDWARNAKVGQRALVGDATALPAISRRLEELPEGIRAFVFVLAAPETGFAWGGGEASAMVRLRQLLAGKGVADHHENL